jgi:hypothetical protein
MSVKYIKISLVLAVLLSSFFAVPAEAKKSLKDATGVLGQVVPATGYTATNLPQTVPEIIGFWIKIALQVVGVTFFVLMIYAGFKWMLARGAEEQITTAKNTIIMAAIGMVIVISGYAITNFVVTRVVEGQANNPVTQTPDLTAGPMGCCVEWIKGAGMIDAKISKACYISTADNCELQGQAKGCEGEGEGCWLWFEDAAKYTNDSAGNNNCAKEHC